METLQNMRAFVRIIEVGSFTAAAESMNTTTGVMSRAITELEARLRTRLMNRSTRRLALTSAGESYLRRCRQILADIDHAEEEASSAHKRPAGVLRIRSLPSVGHHYVLPALTCYHTQYPNVSIELSLSQQMPDLFDGTSDMAVVAAWLLPDSDLVSHFLGSTFSILCASPDYVKRHSEPVCPRDLVAHACLTLRTPAFPTHEWVLEGPSGVDRIHVLGPVQTNTAESLALAIRDGIGIGILPVYSALDALRDGTLVRVLPDHILQRMNVYALHPSRKFIDAKVRTWVEMLRARVPEMISRDVEALNSIARAPQAP
ncbi:LysR family transcriptional regulator [Paraburkholderia sp. JHI869]|uniref:LysR family transcriptional regulator n=1 Tax=Paraburkholderia sp. JHI869 TaxID=3112959 RepID=UPI0031737D65